jgi:hypothetical protein
MEVFQKVLKWDIAGVEDMTGLPEYRNGKVDPIISRSSVHSVSVDLGGLLVDLGVLTLKDGALPIDPKSGLPHAQPSHPAIVEWRAMTVIEL